MHSHKGYLPITGGDDCYEQGSNPGGAEFFFSSLASRGQFWSNLGIMYIVRKGHHSKGE